MAKSPRVSPSLAELDKSVEDVLYVMTQCAAYFVWWTQIKPLLRSLAPRDQPYEKLIQDSVLESNLLFIRKLNEFFKDRPKKDEREDDLRAYDFPGFEATGAFLHPDDPDELHKRVAHITLKQVREGKVSWEIHAAAMKAVKKSVTFLNFLINDFYVSNHGRRQYILEQKVGLECLLARMQKAIEKQ